MRKALLSALLCLVAAASAALAASPLDPVVRSVRKTVLPNGLTLLVRETPGTGIVAINTWVKGGYFNEPDEVAGMAHLFEHMFFKGSKQFPGAEQISTEIASAGGRSNASTIYDTTNYYFVVPSESLRRGLEIQADAIANPTFDPAELKKEAEVVIEESNRKLDNPPAVSVERMYAVAFEKHRMKRWRIGSNEVLRNIKRDNLLAFFRTVYRPQNMVLAVVGDVKQSEVQSMVEQTFGTIPKGSLKLERGPVEPPQTAFRYGQSAADVRQGYSVFGFHTVPQEHADTPALELLAAILGRGRASRLSRSVIAPEAASTIDADNQSFGDIGIFQVQASFDEKNRAEVDRRVVRALEAIKAAGPSEQELQRAKNLIESQALLRLQSSLGQAETLGGAEAVGGGYQQLPLRLQRLAAVTSKTISDVARRYLTVENMTLYHYRPKNAPEMTRDAALASIKAAMATPAPALKDDAVAIAPSVPARPAAALREWQQFKLSNGATLVVNERPGAPVVAAAVFFRGGRDRENSSIAGITQLMLRTTKRGTTSRDAEQIDREFEFLGTQLASTTTLDFFGYNFAIPAKNFRPEMLLAADVILHPTFPAERVAEEQAQQIAAISRAADSSAVRPLQLAAEAMYRNHPYALPPDGYANAVQALDSSALRAWWAQHVNADDAFIAIAGDIATDDAREIAESAFGKLPARSGQPPAKIAIPAPSRAEIVEFRDRKQSAIAVQFPAVLKTSPDYAEVELLRTIASSGAGTLFTELRSKRSLAYTVSLTNRTYAQTGALTAYMATDAAKEETAKSALVAELRRLQKDAITPEHMARAKGYYAGTARLLVESNGARVNEAAVNFFAGVPLDFTTGVLAAVQKLTIDDAKAAAAKYLGGDNYVVAIVRGKP